MLSDTSRDLLIVNARLIDGTGAPPRAPCALRIRDGIIREIADSLQLDTRRDEERVLELGGATLLPGLIDPHIHIQAVPGAAFRRDPKEQRRRARRHQLRGYLACGVTTVLDAGVSAPVLKQVRSYLDGGGAGPRYLALAPALYPPNGYLDHNELTDAIGTMWPPTGSAADLQERFGEYEGIEGIVGIKVFIERGLGEKRGWAKHPPELLDHFVEQADRAGLPLYAHAIQMRDHRVAVGLKPRAIMHSGFLDEPLDDEHIEALLTAGSYQLTTLSILFDGLLGRRECLRGITDPFVLRAVAPDQIRTAEDPKAWRWVWRQLIRTFAPPWVPTWMCTAATAVALPWAGERHLRRDRERCRQALLRLVKAGVPIVSGTDAGASPMFLSAFHGPSTVAELEILGGLGLDPMAVIEAGTRIPAEMLGIDDQVGTVEVGKAADLVVLADDPLADLGAFRSLKWTIQDGRARRPDEWMTA